LFVHPLGDDSEPGWKIELTGKTDALCVLDEGVDRVLNKGTSLQEKLLFYVGQVEFKTRKMLVSVAHTDMTGSATSKSTELISPRQRRARSAWPKRPWNTYAQPTSKTDCLTPSGCRNA
jgi:hypothetical protein